MLVKFEVHIFGEILQIRDKDSGNRWSDIYPGETFRSRGVPFTYDELRGMGNGKHQVNAKNPAAE